MEKAKERDTGSNYQRMDSRGRVVLEGRESFGITDTCHVAMLSNSALAVFSPPAWAQLERDLRAADVEPIDRRNFERLFMSTGQEPVPVDKQGRFVVPQMYRRLLKWGDDDLYVGGYGDSNGMEIWKAEVFETLMLDPEERARDQRMKFLDAVMNKILEVREGRLIGSVA